MNNKARMLDTVKKLQDLKQRKQAVSMATKQARDAIRRRKEFISLTPSQVKELAAQVNY